MPQKDQRHDEVKQEHEDKHGYRGQQAKHHDGRSTAVTAEQEKQATQYDARHQQHHQLRHCGHDQWTGTVRKPGEQIREIRTVFRIDTMKDFHNARVQQRCQQYLGNRTQKRNDLQGRSDQHSHYQRAQYHTPMPAEHAMTFANPAHGITHANFAWRDDGELIGAGWRRIGHIRLRLLIRIHITH